jgi:hypothetical protein
VEADVEKHPEIPVSKRRSTDLIGTNTNAHSRQQNFRGRKTQTNENEDPRDHYNNHILRSLERIAQKATEERKSLNGDDSRSNGGRYSAAAANEVYQNHPFTLVKKNQSLKIED